MRQSHQKSRSRGRNRKPQNPMSRNYESNGPDVKIRGNAGHIAEKYSTLARDALSNGDTVMAENYLQHAEHYNRLIAAAQLQRAEENAANMAANGRGPQPEVSEEASEASDTPKDQETTAETKPSDASDDSQEEAKPRKNGRGRRTKRAPIEASTEAESDKSSKEVNGSEDHDASDADVISDDAASLPQSITGDLRAEEA